MSRTAPERGQEILEYARMAGIGRHREPGPNVTLERIMQEADG